jgi:hypothetical protein
MSTKENLTDALGIEAAEVVDANTLLQDYNPGSDINIVDNNDDEPEPAPATKKDSFVDEEEPDALALLEDFKLEDEDEDPAKPSKKPEVKKQPTPEVTDDSDDEDSAEDNFFEVFGKNLTKLGILDELEEEEAEDFEWNQDTFVERFEESSRRKADDFIQQAFARFGPKQQDFLWKVAVEGVDPELYFEAQRRSEIVQSFDPSTEENKERIMFEYFRLVDPERNFEDIKEEIQDLKDLNKLDKKAEQAKSKLVKYFEQQKAELVQNARQQQVMQERQRQQFESAIEQSIKSAVEKGNIDNIPFSRNDEGELFEYLTATPYKTEQGHPVTEMYKDFVEAQRDPEKLLKLAKFLKSGLKIDTAIKKAEKKAKEEMWDFGLTKRSRKPNTTSSTKGGFLD